MEINAHFFLFDVSRAKYFSASLKFFCVVEIKRKGGFYFVNAMLLENKIHLTHMWLANTALSIMWLKFLISKSILNNANCIPNLYHTDTLRLFGA